MAEQTQGIATQLGRVIHALRCERGLSQAELAALTSLRQPNLSRIENGMVMPRRGTLEKLAQALGVNATDLLSPERVQMVEAQWRAALTPRNAGQLFAGQLSAVPLYHQKPLEFDAAGRLTGHADLVLQLGPLPGRAFALVLPDDSMQARRISKPEDSFSKGDWVVFSSQPEVGSGDFAYVVTPRLRLFRRVTWDGKAAVKMKLLPLNERFPQLTVSRSDVLAMYRLVLRFQHF
jgi:transcriptional regulator with XRE-family HTH domain